MFYLYQSFFLSYLKPRVLPPCPPPLPLTTSSGCHQHASHLPSPGLPSIAFPPRSSPSRSATHSVFFNTSHNLQRSLVLLSLSPPCLIRCIPLTALFCFFSLHILLQPLLSLRREKRRTQGDAVMGRPRHRGNALTETVAVCFYLGF